MEAEAKTFREQLAGRARKEGVVGGIGLAQGILYICRKIEDGTQYNKMKTMKGNIELVNIIFRVGAYRSQRPSYLEHMPNRLW